MVVELDARTAAFEQRLSTAEGKLGTFKKQVGATGADAGALGNKYALAGRQIAGSFENIARSGKLAGDSAKQVLSSASEVAFAFGPTGAIVGAASIAGLAIVEIFQRTRKEMEETRKKAVDEANKMADELDALQNKRDVGGLAARKESLERGTPAKNFKDSLAEQEKALTEFQQHTEAEIAVLQQKAAAVVVGGSEAQIRAADARIAEITAQIKQKQEALGLETNRVNALRLEANQIDARIQQLRSQPLSRTEEIESLGKIIALGAATGDEMKRAAELTRDLKKELASLPVTPQTASQRAGILDQIKSLTPKADTRADTTASALASVRQELAALSASLTTDNPLDNIAAKFDGLRDRVLALKGQPAAVITELTAEVERLRQAAIQVEQAKIDKIIDEMAIRESATLTDDLREKFDALLKTLTSAARGNPAFLAQIEEIRQMADESVNAQGTIEDVAREFDAFKSRVGDGVDVFDPEQLSAVSKMAERLRAIVADEQVANEVREHAKQLLEQIDARYAAIGSNIFKIPEKTKEVNRGLSATVDNLLQGAKAALALAGAMGLIGSETAQALQNVVELGVGIAKIVTTGGKQGIPESIAAAVNLAISAFGESPADKQRAKELRDNTEQLARLNRNVGDLVGSDIPGNQFARVQRGLEALIAKTGTAGGFRRFGDDGPLRSLDPKRFFESLGLDFDEVKEIADEFGIVLNGTKQSYLDLLQAIKQRDLELFLDSFAGKLSQLEATLDIEGVTDPIDRFVRRAKLLAESSPLFAEIFEGLDLSSIEGRAEAAKRLRAQWEAFIKDPEKFRAALEASGLSLDEWREQMLDVNRELTEAAIAANKFADALAGIDLDLEIAGDENPVSRANKVVKAGAEADKRLEGVLGFNLSTAEGRAQAEKFLQSLSLGADDEFKQIIVELLRAIRAIPDAVDGNRPGELEIVANAAKGLTETTGNRMADYLATLNILVREIIALLRGDGGAEGGPTSTNALSPLTPPVIPSASALAVASAVTIQNLSLPPVTIQSVPNEAPEQTATRFTTSVLQQLARDLTPIFVRQNRDVQVALGRPVAG